MIFQEISNKKALVLFLSGVILYGASLGASFAVFSFFPKPGASFVTPLPKDTTSPKAGVGDTPCPVNGQLFTKDQAKNWQERRPLGVMIENHVEARPQSGLSRADVIYEAVAEGGITRFLAIYFCQDAGDINPVRSARSYYLDWLSEYGSFPLYAHVGGANTPGPANALGQLTDYGWRKANGNDLDQFTLGFPTYWRSADKFAPHNVHSSTAKLFEAGAKRGFTNVDTAGASWNEKFVQWQFKDEPSLQDRPTASQSAKVGFWAGFGQYAVDWQYVPQNNSYKRSHQDTPQIDVLTNEQLEAKTVVVQFEDERRANDGYPGNVHIIYKTAGKGKALVFQDGKVITATWEKKDRLSRTKYLDPAGAEIKFDRGLIWIQVVPTGAEVRY